MNFSYYTGGITVRGKPTYTLLPSHTINLGDESINVPESDYSNESKLIQDAFVAIKDLTVRSQGAAKFYVKKSVVHWNELIITPDNKQDLGLPIDIFAFADAIFPNEQAPATCLYRAKQRISKLQN